MITDKIKQLAAAKAEAAQLEAEISADIAKTLAGLPAEFGFESAAAFIKAVRKAAGGGKRGKRAAASEKKSGGGQRRRAKITDATRADVKRLVGEKKTGIEIARALGISLPSVQNIKTALGLVAKRKK